MKVSKREKRFLLVGVSALLANLLFVYVIEPAIDYQLEVRKQIERKQAILDRHRPPVPGKEHYQSRVTELKAQVSAAEALFLKESKPTLAAANLQGLIHKIGQESGLSVIRENVLASKPSESFVEVPIELTLRGDMKALREFLYRVQAAPYLLTLSKLVIKKGPPRPNLTFAVDLQVVGYIQGQEKK